MGQPRPEIAEPSEAAPWRSKLGVQLLFGLAFCAMVVALVDPLLLAWSLQKLVQKALGETGLGGPSNACDRLAPSHQPRDQPSRDQ